MTNLFHHVTRLRDGTVPPDAPGVPPNFIRPRKVVEAEVLNTLAFYRESRVKLFQKHGLQLLAARQRGAHGQFVMWVARDTALRRQKGGVARLCLAATLLA